MWHTLAWSKSIADATLDDLTPVPDQIVQVQNAHFLPPDDLSAYAAVAYGTNMQRCRVTTPKLRQISPIFLRPLQGSLVAVSNAAHVLLDKNPLRFRGQEEIVVEAIQNSGGAQRQTVGMLLGRQLAPVPPGDVYVIRGSGTTAAVANTWSPMVYTLDQNLPAGRYACLLIEHISTNSQLVRMIFDNTFYRPGLPGIPTGLSRLPYPWYEYHLGVMGYFVTYSLPRVEVLCNGADAAHEFYFHVVPIPS